MLILSCILGFSVLCFLLAFTVWEDFDEVLIPIGVITFVIFLFFIAGIPINRVDTRSSIAKFNATLTTLEMARKQGNVLENAALQQKVLEQNQWLAEAQYYKSSVWSLWVCSDVNKIQPIK